MVQVKTPETRVLNLYWWIVWGALLLLLPLRITNGSSTDLLRDTLYVGLTLGCQRVERRWPRAGILLHLVLLFPLLTLHALDPHSFGQRMGGNFVWMIFATTSAWPVFGLTALWGWRGALGGLLLSIIGRAFVGVGGSLWGVAVSAYPLILSILLGLLFYWLMSEIQTLYKKLHETSLVDPMTGLFNRRALNVDFGNAVSLAVRERQPVLFSSWDVNGLKAVNDLQGHAAGDAFLLSFVVALRQSTASSDRLYRVGGDEFVGLHVGSDAGYELYEKVKAVFPAVAAGWVLLEGHGLEDAMAEADQRLYACKAADRTSEERRVDHAPQPRFGWK